jgi:hypothetical protein
MTKLIVSQTVGLFLSKVLLHAYWNDKDAELLFKMDELQLKTQKRMGD